jgi:hypothetical protein
MQLSSGQLRAPVQKLVHYNTVIESCRPRHFRKVKKAMEFNEKGSNILIIKEADYFGLC